MQADRDTKTSESDVGTSLDDIRAAGEAIKRRIFVALVGAIALAAVLDEGTEK